MRNLTHYFSRCGQPLLPLLLGLAVAAIGVGPAAAQVACEATLPGCPRLLPPVPPDPPQSPEVVRKFVEGLSNNDAVFEVIVGQGRILTVREDLIAAGRQTLIALGNPDVADFALVNARQIRITGRRLGVTDLSITTPDNRTYSFEIRVVADLDTLRGQIRCLFPDACVKLSHVREHIVVEGQARDPAQVARIIEVIRAYLLSIRASEVKTAATYLPPVAPEAL